MNKIIVLSVALIITGCLSEYPASKVQSHTPTPDHAATVDVRATSIYANAAVDVANAQATADQADRDLRVTQTAVAIADVTRAAIADRDLRTRVAVQATLDHNSILEAEARVTTAANLRDAAAAGVKTAKAELELKQLEVVSSTHAVTTTIAASEMEYRQGVERSSNFFYGLADWFFYVVPRIMIGLVLPLILGYILIRVGRTIARWFEKHLEVNGVTYVLTADGPTPLLLKAGDDQQDPVLETGNTETPGNTGNTESGSVSNAEESEFLPVTNQGHPSSVLRMTQDERDELLQTRHEAIGLLAKCVDYYRANQRTDLGQLPRYDDIGMNAEQRGYIVDNLEYSGCVSKRKNKPTLVVPEIGTCAELMRLIVQNKKRVYPVGYHERRQARLDSAVMALPEARQT